MSRETRLAIMAIIVEDLDSVARLNELLHRYNELIIGRLGLPYRSKWVSLMSIALDAPQDQINALSGQIGRLPGLKVKTLYA